MLNHVCWFCWKTCHRVMQNIKREKELFFSEALIPERKNSNPPVLTATTVRSVSVITIIKGYLFSPGVMITVQYRTSIE